jgi:hypothetical protein
MLDVYLCLIKHHTFTTGGGMEIQFRAFFTLALD